MVEDFAPHRVLIASLLSRREDLKIICEVSNGREAVPKAKELQPDVILIDIGLPELNGIEAARLIRELAPHARIVFVTQESSPEMVEEATRLGAYGFVFKADVRTELLTAVDSVLNGKRYFSHREGESDVHDESILS